MIDTIATVDILVSLALLIIGMMLLFSNKSIYGMPLVGCAIAILGMAMVYSSVDSAEWDNAVKWVIVLGMPLITVIVSVGCIIYNKIRLSKEG